MTAIVGVINMQAVAMAADSAVTITAGNGIKKAYNRGHKIFALSKSHPIGIAVYNNATFMGIPLETLIKMYRNQLGDAELATVEAYQQDFIAYASAQITADIKQNTFIHFIIGDYNGMMDGVFEALEAVPIDPDDPVNQAAQGPPIVEQVFTTYYQGLDAQEKNVAFAAITEADFLVEYAAHIQMAVDSANQRIQEKYPGIALTAAAIGTLGRIFYVMTQLKYIFESHSGLVFFGFGRDEIFPVVRQVLIGSFIGATLRMRDLGTVAVSPGTLESNIMPYAQIDVTYSVLTGLDPSLKNEMHTSIKAAFQQAAEEANHTFAVGAHAGANVTAVFNNIGQNLIDKLDKYQRDTITQPILDMLIHMGKEDMAELAESLVNVTSLKRKFTAGFESVGGPVDVAIVTKGDGFVWMKRKQYFPEELNKK